MSPQKKKRITILVLFVMFIAYLIALPSIEDYKDKKALEETKQYLLDKYKTQFVIINATNKGFLMQEYYMEAAPAHDLESSFNVHRTTEEPIVYKDDYLSEKWYLQSAQLINPILLKHIKPPGYASIVSVGSSIEDYGDINEEFMQAQILHPELSKVMINILYVINKGEESVYESEVDHLLMQLKKKGIKRASVDVKLYDLEYYRNVENFEIEMMVHNKSFIPSVALIKHYTVELKSNNRNTNRREHKH